MINDQFPQSHWEILAEIPSDAEVIQFPRNPVDFSMDFLISVTTENGNKWVGNFHGIDNHYYSGVLPWPKQNHLCVIARGIAYVVRINEPDEYEELSLVPIIEALVATDPRIVVFSTFTDLAAYQENGLLWRCEGIAKDGIEILEIKVGQIFGRSDNVNEFRAFTVDLHTGEIKHVT